MDWRTPIAALALIVGVAAIGLCYVLVLKTPIVRHDLPSSPALIAGAPTQAPDMDVSAVADPRPDASDGNAPDLPESLASESTRLVPATRAKTADLGHAPTSTGDRQAALPRVVTPKPARPVERPADGVITNTQLMRIKSRLGLSADQESKWKAFAGALQRAGLLQSDRIDLDQSATNDANRNASVDVKTPALRLVQTLSASQLRNASELSSLLGFRSVSAMVEATEGSKVASEAADPTVPRLEGAPPVPSPSKVPTLTDHRHDGLLTKSEIGRIKQSLRLTPQQEALWPPVAAILQEVGQQQISRADAGQAIDRGMSGEVAQRFYAAALPLLQTLTDEQKAEVRRRARVMGLEEYASYL